jgi:hypothetical protein
MDTMRKILRLFTHELVDKPDGESRSDESQDSAYDLVEDFSLAFSIHGAVASIRSTIFATD